MRRILTLVASALMVVAGNVAAAAGDSPEDSLRRFVEDVSSLSAGFTQTQYDDRGEVMAERSGAFDLARPGRFSWRYARPYEQQIVCDGHEIWNYEPDLAQVTVRDATAVLTDSPAALLAGGRSLTDRFVVSDGGTENGVHRVLLRARQDNGEFGEIELWLDGTGVPSRMRLHDPLGGTSDIRFDHVQRNIAIDEARFRFSVPEGVDLVRLDAPTP